MKIIIGILVLAMFIFLSNLKKSGPASSGSPGLKKQKPAKKKPTEEFILPLADGDEIDEVILEERDL